jgi:hypothetical protein
MNELKNCPFCGAPSGAYCDDDGSFTGRITEWVTCANDNCMPFPQHMRVEVWQNDRKIERFMRQSIDTQQDWMHKHDEVISDLRASLAAKDAESAERWETIKQYVATVENYEASLAAAQAENGRLKEDFEHVSDVAKRDGMQAIAQYERAQKAEHENGRLKEALTYYANEDIYRGEGWHEIENDDGEKARAALKEVK